MNKTYPFYINRKIPCTITPTFRYVAPFIEGKSLDLGVATGEYLERFPSGSVGVDVSLINLEITRSKSLSVVCADINQLLPFKNRSFQTVFCSHTIEHVDAPINLLREVNRVLCPGGKVILAVPVEKTLVSFFREDYFKGHSGHLYGLSVECIERLLEKTGFKSIKKFYNFPLLNRITWIDKILQSVSHTTLSQYFATMYWIVGRKLFI